MHIVKVKYRHFVQCDPVKTMTTIINKLSKINIIIIIFK